ncbi:MAG: hypothetical protein KC592_03635 [Nitrospira sp.]|nr:hypothetical protein [Nitrospira sp.]
MNVSKTLGPLLLVGLLSCSHAVMEAPLPTNTITLEKAAHFQAPEGDEVTVEPGIYQMAVSGQDSLWLFGEQSKGVAYVVQAISTTHEEKVEQPTSVSLSEGEDELHVLLLLEDGKGLEAIGSYSGIQSRRAAPQKRMTPTRITQSVETRQKMGKQSTLHSQQIAKAIFTNPETVFSLADFKRQSPQIKGMPQDKLILQGKWNQSTATVAPTWHIPTWDVGGYTPSSTKPIHEAPFFLLWARAYPNTQQTPTGTSVGKAPQGQEQMGEQGPATMKKETYTKIQLLVNGKIMSLGEIPSFPPDKISLPSDPLRLRSNGDVEMQPKLDTRPSASPFTMQLRVWTSQGRILVSPLIKVEVTPVYSWFEVMLAPIFQHDRCVSCHSVGDHNAIVKYHEDRKVVFGNIPGVKPHNPEFCNGCHGIFAADEWFSPAFLQGLNWTKATSPKQICEKATGPFTYKNGQIGPPLTLHHHFHDDPRIHWAVSDGRVPYNRPPKPVPLLNQLDTFFSMVDRWTIWNSPCPKTLYVDGQ